MIILETQVVTDDAKEFGAVQSRQWELLETAFLSVVELGAYITQIRTQSSMAIAVLESGNCHTTSYVLHSMHYSSGLTSWKSSRLVLSLTLGQKIWEISS